MEYRKLAKGVAALLLSVGIMTQANAQEIAATMKTPPQEPEKTLEKKRPTHALQQKTYVPRGPSEVDSEGRGPDPTGKEMVTNPNALPLGDGDLMRLPDYSSGKTVYLKHKELGVLLIQFLPGATPTNNGYTIQMQPIEMIDIHGDNSNNKEVFQEFIKKIRDLFAKNRFDVLSGTLNLPYDFDIGDEVFITI